MGRTFSRAAGAALLVLVAGVGGCSDDPAEPGETAPDQVAVRDNFFSPQTAPREIGNSVTWTWEGDNLHNVTWDEADLPNSETQQTGSHQVTLPTEPGEFGYHCTIHGAPGAGMFGTLVVE